MSCPSLDVVSAYCANELPEADAASFEDHYFGCDRCVARLERMRALVGRLETIVPHVLTPERRRRLEAASGPVALERLEPGDRGTITFARGVDLGFWVMRAPLAAAARVDLELRTADGTPLLSLADVPFDREHEELVLACQSTYRQLSESTDLHARVHVTLASGERSVAEYFLAHVFDSP